MYELKVVVTKVSGVCTANPPMKTGDYFTVSNGDLRIPAGGYICLWALQSLMPLLPLKERAIAEKREEDWVWRVHHAQCPDPKGRVIYRLIQAEEEPEIPPFVPSEVPQEQPDPLIRDLRVTVARVRGKCTSGMQPGDYFILRSGRLYIPPERHFCLYALQAVLPLLPAKQRPLPEGDWLREDSLVICPDPAGNVILRIEHT